MVMSPSIPFLSPGQKGAQDAPGLRVKASGAHRRRVTDTQSRAAKEQWKPPGSTQPTSGTFPIPAANATKDISQAPWDRSRGHLQHHMQSEAYLHLGRRGMGDGSWRGCPAPPQAPVPEQIRGSPGRSSNWLEAEPSAASHSGVQRPLAPTSPFLVHSGCCNKTENWTAQKRQALVVTGAATPRSRCWPLWGPLRALVLTNSAYGCVLAWRKGLATLWGPI